MNHLRRTLVVVSMASLLAQGACSKTPSTETTTATSAATSSVLTARLSGAAEVPAVVTDATGTLEANLAAGSSVLNWKITCSGPTQDGLLLVLEADLARDRRYAVVQPLPG